MANGLIDLSNNLAEAVERAGRSVVSIAEGGQHGVSGTCSRNGSWINVTHEGIRVRSQWWRASLSSVGGPQGGGIRGSTNFQRAAIMLTPVQRNRRIPFILVGGRCNYGPRETNRSSC